MDVIIRRPTIVDDLEAELGRLESVGVFRTRDQRRYDRISIPEFHCLIIAKSSLYH